MSHKSGLGLLLPSPRRKLKQTFKESLKETWMNGSTVFGDQLTSEKKHKKDVLNGSQLLANSSSVWWRRRRPGRGRCRWYRSRRVLDFSPRLQRGFRVRLDVGSSDGQVGVCVGGRRLRARVASSLLGDGGRVAVETRQHTFSIINWAVWAGPVPALSRSLTSAHVLFKHTWPVEAVCSRVTDGSLHPFRRS